MVLWWNVFVFQGCTLDILIKMYFCFWRITELTIYIPVVSKGSILEVMAFQCRHSNSESSKYFPHAYIVKITKILSTD